MTTEQFDALAIGQEVTVIVSDENIASDLFGEELQGKTIKFERKLYVCEKMPKWVRPGGGRSRVVTHLGVSPGARLPDIKRNRFQCTLVKNEVLPTPGSDEEPWVYVSVKVGICSGSGLMGYPAVIKQ